MNRAVFGALIVAFATLGAAAPAFADGWQPAHTYERGRTVLFSDVRVPADETVRGDLNVVFGNADIAGTVHGNVNTLFGRCEIEDGAQIDGEPHCISGDAVRAFAPWIVNSTGLSNLADQDRHLWTKLASSAVVVLVFLLFPLRMRLALDRVERHPGLAAIVGAVAFVAVVPIALILLLSLVGIPLILLEVAALVAGVWLGTGAVALVVGRRLCELVLPTATPSPLLALVMGLVVVSAAEIVPVMGWVVTALVWLVGLGAAIMAFVPLTGTARARWPIGGPPMNRPV